MNRNARFESAPGIEIREVTDGYVVYDPARDRLHYLNPTATMLLESCDGTMGVNELRGLLAAAFQLKELPLEEVERCVSKLLEEGLLVCRDGTLAG